jgi:hypothetical protein
VKTRNSPGSPEETIVVQFDCHPEQALLRSEDLGEPSVSPEPALRERERPKGASGSPPYQLRDQFDPPLLDLDPPAHI